MLFINIGTITSPLIDFSFDLKNSTLKSLLKSELYRLIIAYPTDI